MKEETLEKIVIGFVIGISVASIITGTYLTYKKYNTFINKEYTKTKRRFERR